MMKRFNDPIEAALDELRAEYRKDPVKTIGYCIGAPLTVLIFWFLKTTFG